MIYESRDHRVRSETTFWIDCSACGPDAAPAPPRFRSENELWDALLHPDDDGWIRRDDGRILCPVHRRIAECDEHGHVLSSWTTHPLDDGLEWRSCSRCGAEFAQRRTPTS